MRSIVLTAILCAAPVALCANSNATPTCTMETCGAQTQHHAQEHTQGHAYTQIDSEQLRSFYDQNKQMVVLDARSKPYFEGTLLPNAKWIPADTVSEAEIQGIIPSKDTLVVVYCANSHCPAGGWLADKLVEMGYTNVHKYPGGLDDWMQKGYPTTRQ